VIVTIDGPAGSGKSTTARGAAERLGYVYLDTGAMYRAVTLAFLQEPVEPTPEAADQVLSSLQLDVRYEGGTVRVIASGEDVTESIRSQEVGAAVSDVSSLPAVRNRMVEAQRRIGKEKEAQYGGVVLDGRDTGTVVFPDADVKIFLVAALDERARRRHEQYREEGRNVSLSEVRKEIQRRDEKDRNRDLAPLRRAEDAITFDSTDCTIDEQIQFVVDRVKAVDSGGT